MACKVLYERNEDRETQKKIRARARYSMAVLLRPIIDHRIASSQLEEIQSQFPSGFYNSFSKSQRKNYGKNNLQKRIGEENNLIRKADIMQDAVNFYQDKLGQSY